MANLYIGTSGFTYRDWRHKFYPKGVATKNWLNYYAQHYNAVEINASFYRSFSEEIYGRWREATPDGFRFVLKGPRIITHEKRLIDVEDDLRGFAASVQPLGEKLAAVLWQMPPSARAGDLRIPFARFMLALPAGLKHVFEFRHSSWFNEEHYEILNEFGVGFVINDTPQFPTREAVTGGLMYVRFHGPGKLYDSVYTDEQLEAWAERIKPKMETCDTFLFFNNTFAGKALDNANTLRALLQQ